MRVARPAWEMGFPGLELGHSTSPDEEQMHTESGAPPTPPLQPRMRGGDSFQMGLALSNNSNDPIWFPVGGRCGSPSSLALSPSGLGRYPTRYLALGQVTWGTSALLRASVSPSEKPAFPIKLARQSSCILGKLRRSRKGFPKLWRAVHMEPNLPGQPPLEKMGLFKLLLLFCLYFFSDSAIHSHSTKSQGDKKGHNEK